MCQGPLRPGLPRCPFQRHHAPWRADLADLVATIAAYVAERFGRLEQVATVVTPANRKGTSEKAAQRLGLRLRSFTDPGAAASRISAGPP